MVNREKRDLAVSLLRKFLAGDITNDGFANAYPKADGADAAIGAIYEGLWFFWDDRGPHTLTGEHEPSTRAKLLFDRCVVFLESDLEYEWPPIKRVSFLQAILRASGLKGVADRRSDVWMKKMNSSGDFDLWPFIRREDWDSTRSLGSLIADSDELSPQSIPPRSAYDE